MIVGQPHPSGNCGALILFAPFSITVGQLEKDVGVAGVCQLAGADQVLATQLAGVETRVPDVLAVEQLGRFAPSGALVGVFNVGFAPEAVYVRLLERVCPLRPLANEYRADEFGRRSQPAATELDASV